MKIFNHFFCPHSLAPFLLPVSWVKTFPWSHSLVSLAFFLYPHSFEVFNLKYFSGFSYSFCDGSSHNHIFSSDQKAKLCTGEAALSGYKFGLRLRRPGKGCKSCNFTCFVTQSKPPHFWRLYSPVGNNY